VIVFNHNGIVAFGNNLVVPDGFHKRNVCLYKDTLSIPQYNSQSGFLFAFAGLFFCWKPWNKIFLKKYF
jgi:hypothetical protein